MQKALIVFFSILAFMMAIAWFEGDKVSVTEVVIAAVAGISAAIEDVLQQLKEIRKEIERINSK